MFKLLNILIMILFFSLNIAYGQIQTRFVNPIETDPQINIKLEPHYVALNKSVTSKKQLFLFFPGTSAIPMNYRLITNRAANLGFHAINLSYPNQEAVNTLCANENLDCYGNVRLEILEGKDTSTLVNVNRTNSIENRLIKLLIFLKNQNPNDGWEQFLINNSEINWSSIVVSGHSQGGGHAGFIGRYRPIVRSVMFAANDFNAKEGKVATWIANPSTTPNASSPDKFWAFHHQKDELAPFIPTANIAWPAYGMPAFGQIANVDSSNSPYQNTHSLTSSLTITSPLSSSPHHGGIVADVIVPKKNDGTPIYQPIWDYLLSNTNLDNTSPIVKVISPNGGEQVNVGSQLNITFSSKDDFSVRSQDINLSTDGGVSFPVKVASGLIGGMQSFSFSVPEILANTMARVQVIARDEAGNVGMDVSDGDFVIVKSTVKDTTPPLVTISSPTMGTTFNAGMMANIRFFSKDDVEVVSQNVFLSTNGSTFNPLVMGLNGTSSSFSFQIPLVNTTNAAIKVEAIDAAGNKGSAIVEQLKIVIDTQAPSIRVTSPDSSNKKLNGNSQFLVTFVSSDNIGVMSHDIQIALDGVNFTTLVSGLAGNATSAMVTVPNMKSKTSIIRVIARDFAGNVGTGNSSVFRIKPQK